MASRVSGKRSTGSSTTKRYRVQAGPFVLYVVAESEANPRDAMVEFLTDMLPDTAFHTEIDSDAFVITSEPYEP